MWRAHRCLPILLALACGAPGETHRVAHRQLGDAIAVVNGEPIARDEVVRLVNATGMSPKRALEVLVSERLLVAHAQERGYDALPAVERATEQAMVRALLAAELGTSDPARVEAQRARLDALLESLAQRTQVRFEEEAIARAFANSGGGGP